MSDKEPSARTDLVIEGVDLHPEERERVEYVVRQMVDGGRVYVLPPDTPREKRELFGAVAAVCHRIDGEEYADE